MLYQFLSGDLPLSLTIWIVLAVWANGHRSTVRDFWSDPSPFWRVVERAAKPDGAGPAIAADSRSGGGG